MDQAHTPTIPGLANDAFSAAGGLLGGASRGLTNVRTASKPLHPRGEIVTGVLTRSGSARCGVPWLESPGTDEVLVRVSRAVGLPDAVPDIHGLAVRVPAGERHGDLLLASTGFGRVSRFVLLPGRTIRSHPLTTLLPYRSPCGPLLIAARPIATPPRDPAEPLRFELSWARWLHPWVRFGELAVSTTEGPDPDISFDPVRNPLPGLACYGWVRRLRAPAYRAAREASHRDPTV